jgi:hypothetical protein
MERLHRTLCVWATLWGLGGASSAAWATTLLHLDWQDLVQFADVIVRAKVESVKGKVHVAESSVAFTEVKLIPLETFKGASLMVNQPDITLHLPGGKTPEVQLHISASGTFVPKTEVMVFLEATDQDHFVLLGMTQGKFEIYTDPVTRVQMAKRDVAGLHTLIPTKHGAFVSGTVTGTSDDQVPYDLLKSMILSNGKEPKGR